MSQTQEFLSYEWEDVHKQKSEKLKVEELRPRREEKKEEKLIVEQLRPPSPPWRREPLPRRAKRPKNRPAEELLNAEQLVQEVKSPPWRMEDPQPRPRPIEPVDPEMT